MSEAQAPAPSAPTQAPVTGPTSGVQTVPPEAGAMSVGRRAEATQRAVEALRKAREAKPESDAAPAEPARKARSKSAKAEAPAPAASEVTTAEATPTPAAPSESAPQESAKPAAPDVDAKLARALTGAQKAEARALAAEQQLAEARKTLEQVTALQDRLKKDPLSALKDAGWDYETLTRKVISGEISATTAAQLAQEQTSTEVAGLKQMIDELKRERDEQRAQQVAAQEVEFAKKRIAERAETSPLLNALPWAPTAARERFYSLRNQGQDVEFESVLADMESAASSDIRAILSSERAAKSLFADKQIRETVIKALGLGDKPRAASEPRAEPSKTDGRALRDGPSTLVQDHAAEPSSKVVNRYDPKRARQAAIAALQRRRSA